ncbi:AraC family transcriptional regulator [Amycolatopsis sp. NBC_01480]|uniref:AraC family transcriptional regulator n=1 Tax=Amycolatopsis sp. NBC_01480 TaxID=2903562 RepID=UPI002E2C9228|nr:AraC family transcriptional regulator [Amycolatopsis sp. NBC_01480]
MDVLGDAISAVRLGHPSSDRVWMDGRWCVRLDPYEGAAFLAVMKGGCWLLPDDGASVSLGVGDVVLLLPHGKGYVVADSPLDRVVAVGTATPFDRWHADAGSRARDDRGETEVLCGKYRVDRSRLHPLLTQLPEVVHFPSRPDGHSELRAAIGLLASEQDEQRAGSSLALPSLLDLLLVFMIRSWMTDAGHRAWPGALADSVTAAALRALHADPAAPWTNDRLAAEVGVSRPTLARRFTPLVGRPPMAYLTWWRLVRAAVLLRDTTDTLATVARKVGYSSPYAFSHAFAKEYGTTPGRYRSEAGGRSAA